MDSAAIRKVIAGSDLAGEAEAIMACVRPAVRMHVTRTEMADLARGASRLGGQPDLPADLHWPANPGNDARPLEFLAQIDLAEAARVCRLPDLPDTGWLVVFYDLDDSPWGYSASDEGGWRVLYFSGAAEKLIRARPADGKVEIFQPCALCFEREDCLPDIQGATKDFGPRDRGEWDRWWKLQQRLKRQTGEPLHRLGGYPSLVQSGVDDDNWEFLLHLDTDEEGPGWMWGDAGRIYYWACRNCREAGDPIHAWCTVECY